MNRSREVFVLGAGFSRALSEHMPVLSELSNEVFDSQSVADARLRALMPDFEQCLTYLAEDHPWLSESDNLMNRARFLAASRALARTILDHQKRALADQPPTWAGDLVAAWHRDRSVVISFNYDTLVEKAYTHFVSAEVASAADHSELYAVPVPDIRSRTSSRWGREARDTFSLLKLHGSVNWCYSGAPSYFGETIYDLGIEPGWSKERAEPVDDLERKAPEKVQLVVPPTTTKSALFNNELMRSQWRLSRQHIENAERIYCLGYSLPETDQMVRHLIATAPPGKMIVPVNTRSVSRRYARRFGPHVVGSHYERRKNPIQAFVGDWMNDAVRTEPTKPVERH